MTNEHTNNVNVVHVKNYPTTVFVLDQRTLQGVTRCVVDCIEQGGDAVGQVIQTFVVRRARDERLEPRTLQELLDVENTVGNPIVAVEYACGSGVAGSGGRRIDVRFDRLAQDRSVRITVSGPNDRWVSRSSAALSEQVERTLRKGYAYRLAARVKAFGAWRVAALFAAFAGMSALLLQAPFTASAPFNLSAGQQATLRALAARASTDAEKVDFVYQVMVAATADVGGGASARWLEFLARPRSYMIIVPMLFIIVAGAIMLRSLSQSFFVWGDHVDRYQLETARRERLLTGVLLAFAVSIFSNMVTAATGGP